MKTQLDCLVRQFESGALTRRQLIAALVAVCAAPAATAASQSAPPKIQVGGIDHVALRVSDLARSTRFYAEHLSATIRSQSSNATFLDVGSDWIALFAEGAVSTGFAATRPGVDHISFDCSSHRSFDERYRALEARGLNPASPAGSSRVYFRDPDGVILQLS